MADKKRKDQEDPEAQADPKREDDEQATPYAGGTSIDPEVTLDVEWTDDDDESGERSETIESLLSATSPEERYAVDKEVNRGGMGAILQAVDRDLRREVAMKVMLGSEDVSEEELKRFVEEAQVTGQLEHPNIVPIHELGLDKEGRVYFTMKMVQGRSLADELEEKGPAGGRDPARLSELLHIFLKVCDGVAFAHSKGVIHRDLKPENIMVGQFGEVLVMDWGLARLHRRGVAKRAEGVKTLRDEQDGGLTQAGDIMGTPSYMPPEQAQGMIEEIDKRSDIYSLGAVLYELLVGKPPFQGKTVQNVLIKVVEGKLIPPEQAAPDREIPPELSAICMKAMAYEKADRYRNAANLARDIRSFLDGRMVGAFQYNPLQFIWKWLWMHRAAVAGALLVLAVCLGAWGYVRYRDHQRALVERDRAIAKATALRDDGITAFREARKMDVASQSLSSLQQAYQKAIDLYKGSLSHLPADLEREKTKTRALMGEVYFKLFDISERKENPELTASYGRLTQEFLGDKYDRVIRGDGMLDVTTTVPASILLLPAREPRRVVAGHEHAPGPYVGFSMELAMKPGETPLKNETIPMGSWLLLARAEGMKETRMPIWVERNGHVVIENLKLLKASEIPAGMVYVPGGSRRAGAPAAMRRILRAGVFRREKHHGFFIGAREVTNEDWWGFLKHKMDTSPRGWAAYRPRTVRRGQDVFLWTPEDAKGITRSGNWEALRRQPVVGVSWQAASDYAKWKGARLPSVEEWQIAARGADARLYAWGNLSDLRKANVIGFMSSTVLRGVGRAPFDLSPCGAFDMTGNAAEWTADWLDEALQVRSYCGAHYNSRGSDVILFVKRGEIESSRLPWLGFRIAKDLPWAPRPKGDRKGPRTPRKPDDRDEF